jgi:hypothetical protein
VDNLTIKKGDTIRVEKGYLSFLVVCDISCHNETWRENEHDYYIEGHRIDNGHAVYIKEQYDSVKITLVKKG